MRQELHAITTANVAKGSEIHRFSISTSCFACGDTSEKISGGEVLCQFCLMILDNSSNWGLFFTDKGNLWQQAMEACNQSTMVQDSTSIISDSTPSTTDASLPQHTSEDKTSLCQVCGASASGLHFGVFTCEGCKCFYRRTIKEGVTYVCTKSNDCSVTMETRNSCRYCRFQKCMALGMCKEGIKLGRRPKTDGDLHLTNHFSKIDVPPNAMNVPRWHSWPTFPTICQPPIKQESIYPSDMHQCYGSQYPIKNQHCSYPKQKLHSVPNDLIDPSYDFGGEPYLLGHNMQSSFTPAYHQSSQHISYNHTMYQQGSPQEQLSPSLSMTLPEVHSGAYTAMAYANMYRGQHANEFFFDASTNVKTESKDDLELTELKPLEKKNQIVSETGIVSFSTAMSYDTCQQFKENQKHNPQINSQELPIENALKRRLPDEDGNNNSKLQKTNVLVSKNFVIVYEHLEKLVVDEWTSSLKSSDNMSEVLNPQKSSMPKVKACFKKFAETISGFQDLANESKDELIRQALCPVLGIIITHYFTNKTQGAHPVLSHESVGCGEEIQRLGSLEMAVLCGICLTQTEKTEAQKPLDMKKTEQFLQTSLEDVFNADKYHILLDIASKVCHQTSTNK